MESNITLARKPRKAACALQVKSKRGYVKTVGDQAVHLEKLAGRDFYDGLICIDDISAIEAKFRDMK